MTIQVDAAATVINIDDEVLDVQQRQTSKVVINDESFKLNFVRENGYIKEVEVKVCEETAQVWLHDMVSSIVSSASQKCLEQILQLWSNFILSGLRHQD